MAVTEKTISSLVDRQLPDFVKSDHPKFQLFLEKYYQWLERTGSEENYEYGNTVYHIMNAEKYRDIDETIDPFFSFFKQEFLPYFPDKTALDIVKILKGAREFYSKKGSEESVKWLFRALFDTDVNVFYPKKQILIASDGKWKLPQAFNITLSTQNQNIIPNLLEKHKGIGSESAASCVIESANKTVDKTFGNEILEIYVSNVTREFITGENLVIEYVDETGVTQTFSEKIVAQISGVKIDSNIKTDPQEKRRGLYYKVGDPVVFYGGLDDTLTKKDAVAKVSNVEAGSIESVGITFPGYGFRTYSNTEAIAIVSPGDDPNAAKNVDLRVSVIDTLSYAGDSQNSFGETITIDKVPIELLKNVAINTSNYTVFTLNVRNSILNLTENDRFDKYQNFEYVWANGSSFQTANFTGIILTPNTAGFGQGGGSNYTGSLFLYAVANTVALSTTGFLVGQQLYTKNTSKSFIVNSITNAEVPANANSEIIQCLKTEQLQTGGLQLFTLLNGGSGFANVPTIQVGSYYDTIISENYDYSAEYDNKVLWRQTLDNYGRIAHIYIDTGGTGYANGDSITIAGRGYGFTGYVNVNATGTIINTTITNRGEGYYGPKIVTVTSSLGSNSVLSAYGFGEGYDIFAKTSKIGKIKDIKLLSRGFDYISAPEVSLKVVDMVINPPANPNYNKGQFVYQGTYGDPLFTAIIDSYDSTTKVMRLFDYAGNSRNSFNKFLPLHVTPGVNSDEELIDLEFTVNISALVPAPAEYTTPTLSNPYWYGNGSAKAYAEFFNGLIKFPGFYINNDGFVSSDKKLQDGKTYQNYSYVIESDKSLREYKNVVKDIVHPVGMYMLGRAITDSQKKENARTTIFAGKVSKSPVIQGTVSINSLSSSKLATFYNFNETQLTELASANNLLVIDSNSNRAQIKEIKTNFNISTNTVVLESNTMFIGDGRLTFTNGSNVVTVTNKTQEELTLLAADKVEFNVNNTVILTDILSISGDDLTLNITGSSITTSNSNIIYRVYPVFDHVPFMIISNNSN